MSDSQSNHRFTAFTLVVFWGCILLGLGIPWLSTIGVDMLKHGQSIGQALHQLHLHLFAPGYNLFLIALLNAVPFVLFAIFVVFHLGLVASQDRVRAWQRVIGVGTAALGLIAVSGWSHVMMLWYPDAQGALAYVFLPFLLVVLLPVGYAIGRVLGRVAIR
jgi:hypothetical protein